MISLVARLHPDLAFDFALGHMQQVDGKVDVTSRSSYYPGLASDSIDPAMIGKVSAYASANIAASSHREAGATVGRIAYRIKVRNERLPAVDAWLARK